MFIDPVYPPDEPDEFDPDDDTGNQRLHCGPMEPPAEEPEERELEDWITQ